MAVFHNLSDVSLIFGILFSLLELLDPNYVGTGIVRDVRSVRTERERCDPLVLVRLQQRLAVD